MANGQTKKDTNSSKPSDGKLRDSDLIGWLIGFFFFAIIAGSIFSTLQSKLGIFGDSGMGVGALVSTKGDIDVWEEPGTGEILGVQQYGVLGEVLKGPIETNGAVWWYIDFEEAPDGWVDEKGLKVEKQALMVGDIIEMIRDANVWDQAGGGIGRGLQLIGSLGELIGGPVLFDGERWWEIDFDDNSNGWVRESDIARAASSLIRFWRGLMDNILIPSIILSVLLVIGVVVITTRIRGLTVALKEKYQTPATTAFVRSKEERSQEDGRWKRVQELVNTSESASWRLSILEADIILSDIVLRMGYDGETLAERLKQVEKSDFLTLDSAWEAHKVRNTIAHEGGDFILTQREAQRVIALYEKVFKEFHYI